MKKPVILTVDDDVDVLRAVERDLRRQYGERFRVMRADSGATALETVQQIKLRMIHLRCSSSISGCLGCRVSSSWNKR